MSRIIIIINASVCLRPAPFKAQGSSLSDAYRVWLFTPHPIVKKLFTPENVQKVLNFICVGGRRLCVQRFAKSCDIIYRNNQFGSHILGPFGEGYF